MSFSANKKLTREFNAACADRTLDGFYKQTLGRRGANDQTSLVVSALTYKHFCERSVIDTKHGSQMAIAANSLSLQAKMAYENKDIKNATHERAQCIAAIVQPDSAHLAQEWREAASTLTTKQLSRTLPPTIGILEKLEISDSHFAGQVHDMMANVRDRLAEQDLRARVQEASKKAAARAAGGPAI